MAMQQKFFLSIPLILFLLSTAGCCENQHIQQFDEYRQLQKLFDSCDENTLVTFDVDDTLITATDVMANFDFPLWFKIRAFIRYPSLFMSKAALESVFSIIFEQSKRYVFDPDIIQIIKQIQHQGVKVVCLTSMDSGSYGVIKSMPEWRANDLRNLGFDFSGTFGDVTFKSFPAYRNNYPQLFKGILCANQESKGAVLEAFLDHFHLKPERIISFDDQLGALNSIAKLCKKKGIEFDGFQCMGAKKLASPWNIKRALLQLDSVVQHGHWLSDVEADMAGKAV